ncbi:phosphomannomutase [Marinobacter sp. NP-4(2019)]|uniref:phosphomannomutase n=1 Tax=Marinobacter sp. NP-4(2019) TaxID=2488665 RepID=UPI000FC3CEFD|nr:phosphomannomutase [Marinobacter sp. NP-4(2019)]AZT82609.1 phosphomannomutase [Marinobacter sp. NP-4(2019)]
MDLSCFKAYDLRGRVPDQLNPTLAERIGRAYVEVTGAKKVIVGYDIRLSSPEIAEALSSGLMAAGADVFGIGLCGTEQVYFATSHYKMDGGIMVTASHNPRDHNGMKMVGPESRPISSDNGLNDIRDRVPEPFGDAPVQGRYEPLEVMGAYIDHLLGYIDAAVLRPLKIVVNAGNGGAGLVIDQLEQHLPFEFIKVHHQPDGHFPNGVPNPILEENRAATAEVVKANGAAMGIAWDGDYDRCFFFDENGRFIEGYYIVGLLADQFLRKTGGGKVIHDPRLTWNTLDLVEAAGGEAIESKTGHAFIKQRMRDEDAVYGGEMSAHHYFRDFAYCDSGMIPWLLVAERLCQSGQPLSSLIDARIEAYPASGEINRTIANPPKVISAIEAAYGADAKNVSHVDGVSVEFDDWRFNLRMSNTEPVVRLNVESRGDIALMKAKTDELLAEMERLNQ